MTWFKVDDGFSNHPKVRCIPRRDRPAACGLWVLAGSWSSNYLTEGFIPEHMVEELGCQKRLAELLTKVRLWEKVDGGWRFHEWEQANETKADVLKRRADATERQKRARQRAREASRHDDVTRDSSVSHADVTQVTSHVSRLPDPTRPDPTVVPAEPLLREAELPLGIDTSSASDGRADRKPYDHNTDPDFSKFWSVVPEKSGKPSAYAAWLKAIKKPNVTPQLLIERMSNYAEWIKRTGNTRPKYPQGWLNDERWNDASATGRSIQAKQQSPAAFTPYLNPVNDSAYDDWQFTDPEDL